jgi:hypothetical protein
MNRQDVVDDVAHRINAFERNLDDTLTGATELTGFLSQARQHAGFAAEVGHDAIRAMSDAVADLVSARGHVVEAHGVLANQMRAFNIRATSIGGMEKYSASADTGAAAPQLRAVVG